MAVPEKRPSFPGPPPDILLSRFGEYGTLARNYFLKVIFAMDEDLTPFPRVNGEYRCIYPKMT
jgi:hypothetical protein